MSSWHTGRFTVRVGGFTPAPTAPPAPAPRPSISDDVARWRAEGDWLRLAGDARGADEAYARQMRASARGADQARAADALIAGRSDEAEAILRAALARQPDDAVALWILAEAVSRQARNAESEALLERCLALEPGFTAARYGYAMVLNWRDRMAETLVQADRLLAAEPGNPVFLHLRASSLLRLGEDAAAAQAYGEVVATHPDQPLTWMSYGHALKTIGRQAEAIAAYRRALALDPGLGEAWWSLANLKTVRFSADDLAAMSRTLSADLSDADRLQLHFALGKALEDTGRDAEAFDQYARGAAIQRARLDYDPDQTTLQMRRTKALMDARFFAAHAGQGDPRPDPIFILGLPRSGSTLVEQILASHSLIEGTQELPYIPNLAARLAGRARRESEGAYPDVLTALSSAELEALGAEYLARATMHRKLGRPFFIDKLPNNWLHAGFIHLILPHATIIDARRHPLGCCFSAFKQHFAVGQPFSYDLADLGRYYRDYVELMAHFDAVLPGRVHRVIYEDLVADPEATVRRLLDHCGLPFEAACLTFHENDRAVRTASSEQVRQPIFRDAAEHWRRFEPWLGPLKTALGPVLPSYPHPPSF